MLGWGKLEGKTEEPGWNSVRKDHESLYELGVSRLGSFRCSGVIDDIEKAIEFLARALELTPSDHPQLPYRHANLGVSYIDRYARLGHVDDLETSIKHFTRAVTLTPDGHLDLPDRHATLGLSYVDRYRRLGQLDDIEKSIEHFTRALALTPEGHSSLSDRHADLGVSYSDRYQRMNQPNDLEKSTEYFVRALALAPDDHPDLSDRHANVGVAYANRYRRLEQLGDLEISIEHRTRALALTPNGHPSLPERHAHLGTAYGDRYRRLGQMDDLETSIEHRTRALTLTPDGHPSLPNRQVALGASYTDRYRRLGQVGDLERSIEHKSRALGLTPDGHPSLSSRHCLLGASYNDRYRYHGRVNDLDVSLEHFSRALALTPDGHPDLALRHADLGVSHNDRYRRLGQVGDLEKSIEQFNRALELTHGAHPSLAGRHAALGVAYSDRYQRLGELDDVEQSIKHCARALALTPDGHPELSDWHSHLGTAYGHRYQRLGQIEDLEASIEHDSCALALSPGDHPGLSNKHAHLGVSYTNRYRRLGRLDDLQALTEQFTRALTLTPDGHPSLSDRHAHLGVAYTHRYQRLKQLNDLEKSTEHLACALAIAPDGHPSLPDRHTALGASYVDRYQRLGRLDDLKKSTEHLSRARTLTPDDHPDLTDRHFNQAQNFLLQYQHTEDSSYLTRALLSFRDACQVLTGLPRKKFQNALRWANFASKHHSLNPIEAYQTTIDFLPQFVWLGATTHQRYQDLAMIEGLAVGAASAAILHSDYKLALEWLEHTRCVVWNQSLMLRSPVEELKISHPDLAARLRDVAEQLHNAHSDYHVQPALISGSENSERVGQERRRLAKEYENILTEARTLPKLEDFFQPMKADRLVRAARNGPIAVINCHNDGCDALLVLPEQTSIQHLSLPNFTQEKARNARTQLEACLRRKGLRERGVRFKGTQGHEDDIGTVLSTLWKNVVKPVLDILGYMDNVLVGNLPHITWCPTGALSFLPLHAAGEYNEPGSKVFDYVVSSYIPTLTSLSIPSSSSLNSTIRVLAVGQEHTPGCSPLPGTAKELAHLKLHSQAKAEYTQLKGDQATLANVLNAMEKHDWIHLACHAHQNVNDPTKSGFFLHDGTLDLATINQRSFKNKGLAFLSACQTATGDEELPDEAIHLASGMLMAGYPSVIATMWSVIDSDAPFVADMVYAELMKDGRVGNGEAGRALHNAVAGLRGKVGEKEFARWVPYIHIGS